MRGSGSVVEHLLAKEKVAGSNPVFRSKNRPTIAGHVGPAFCCLELPQLHLVFVTDRMALAICEHNPPIATCRRLHLAGEAQYPLPDNRVIAGVAEWQTLRS